MADTLAEASYFIYVTQVYFCGKVVFIAYVLLTAYSLTCLSNVRGGYMGLAGFFPREWRFVWKTHWTPVKVAYLFCRYWVIAVVPYLLYAFVKDHSKETCEKIYRIPVALAMWNQVGSESVLLIRTYAFFNRNRYILWFLLAAIGGVVAYQLYVDTTQMLLLPFVQTSICFFIAPLLFDTVVTFMTVIKAIAIRRRNGGPNSRLIQTFLREGVFYYILISIANLINGIFYLQPRQVISAINIPLSVMMAPVLACRLILDLRERGSETVSHSDGTGMAAFTTKSVTQNSPFTPPHMRHKSSAYGAYGSRHARAIDSNIVLSTLGSIVADPMDLSLEQDLAETESRIGYGMDFSTAIGGDDGEPIPMAEHSSELISRDDLSDRDSPSIKTPAPTYRTLEMGFRPARAPSLTERGVGGIRVEVEKATATM